MSHKEAIKWARNKLSNDLQAAIRWAGRKLSKELEGSYQMNQAENIRCDKGKPRWKTAIQQARRELSNGSWTGTIKLIRIKISDELEESSQKNQNKTIIRSKRRVEKNYQMK